MQRCYEADFEEATASMFYSPSQKKCSLVSSRTLIHETCLDKKLCTSTISPAPPNADNMGTWAVEGKKTGQLWLQLLGKACPQLRRGIIFFTASPSTVQMTTNVVPHSCHDNRWFAKEFWTHCTISSVNVKKNLVDNSRDEPHYHFIAVEVMIHTKALPAFRQTSIEDPCECRVKRIASTTTCKIPFVTLKWICLLHFGGGRWRYPETTQIAHHRIEIKHECNFIKIKLRKNRCYLLFN